MRGRKIKWWERIVVRIFGVRFKQHRQVYHWRGSFYVFRSGKSK